MELPEMMTSVGVKPCSPDEVGVAGKGSSEQQWLESWQEEAGMEGGSVFSEAMEQ